MRGRRAAAEAEIQHTGGGGGDEEKKSGDAEEGGVGGGPTVSDRTLGRREAVRLLGMGPWRGKRVLEGREGGWSRR